MFPSPKNAVAKNCREFCIISLLSYLNNYIPTNGNQGKTNIAKKPIQIHKECGHQRSNISVKDNHLEKDQEG